eukprot:TRINITY_DN14055_c0_g2_i1.p1 TRINITY_DN14055_c0_g2~~TRINITY_DN14055_c0_g2_i1.p1  ORF type:complete len:1302 (+),score=373.34 TRINITY_DN14055_c0_g2_i1:303-3908(+)
MESAMKETIDNRDPGVRVTGLLALWRAALRTKDTSVIAATLKWIVGRLKKDHEEVTVPVQKVLLADLDVDMVEREGMADLLQRLVDESLAWKGLGAASVGDTWAAWAGTVFVECVGSRNDRSHKAWDIAERVVTSLLESNTISRWQTPDAALQQLHTRIKEGISLEATHRVVVFLLSEYKKARPDVPKETSNHTSGGVKGKISRETAHTVACFEYIQRIFKTFTWSLFERFSEVSDFIKAELHSHAFNPKCRVLPDLVTNFGAWGDKRILTWKPYRDLVRKSLVVMRCTPSWGDADGRQVTASQLATIIPTIPLTTQARAMVFKAKGLPSALAREVAQWCNPNEELIIDCIETVKKCCVGKILDILDTTRQHKGIVLAAAALLRNIEWLPVTITVAEPTLSYLGWNRYIHLFVMELDITMPQMNPVLVMAMKQVASNLSGLSSVVDRYTLNNSHLSAVYVSERALFGQKPEYSQPLFEHHWKLITTSAAAPKRSRKPRFRFQRNGAMERHRASNKRQKVKAFEDKEELIDVVIGIMEHMVRAKVGVKVAHATVSLYLKLSEQRHHMTPKLKKLMGTLIEFYKVHTTTLLVPWYATRVLHSAAWLDAADAYIMWCFTKIDPKNEVCGTLVTGLMQQVGRYKRRGHRMLDEGVHGVTPAQLVKSSLHLRQFVLKFREDKAHLLEDAIHAEDILVICPTRQQRYAGQMHVAAHYLPYCTPATQKLLLEYLVAPGMAKLATRKCDTAVMLGCYLPFAEGYHISQPTHPYVEMFKALTERKDPPTNDITQARAVSHMIVTSLRSYDDVPQVLELLISHIDQGMHSSTAIPSTACCLRCVNSTVAARFLDTVLSRKNTQVAARTQLCRSVVTLLHGDMLKDAVWKEWYNENRGDAEGKSEANKGVKVSLICTLIQSPMLSSSPDLWAIPASLLKEDNDTVYVAYEMLKSLAGTNGVESLNAKCWPVNAPDGLAGLCAKFLNRGCLAEPANTALSRWVDHVMSAANTVVAEVDRDEVIKAVRNGTDMKLLLRCAYAMSQRGHPGVLHDLVGEMLGQYRSSAASKDFKKLPAVLEFLGFLSKQRVWDNGQRKELVHTLVNEPVGLACGVALLFNVIDVANVEPTMEEAVTLLETKGWSVSHLVAKSIQGCCIPAETREAFAAKYATHADAYRRFLAAACTYLDLTNASIVPALLADESEWVASYVATIV